MKTRSQYLFDQDPWTLAEDIPDSDIFFFQIPMSCFASDTSYPFLSNYKKVLTHYQKFHMDFYFGQKDSFAVGEVILQALLKRPGLGRDINQNVLKWSDKLIRFAKEVSRLPLEKYGNKQLWELYNTHDKIHTKLYTYGWLPVAVDMFHNNLTRKLKSYLYKVCPSKNVAEAAFIVFTTPSQKTIVAKEREDFLAIYEKHKKILHKSKAALIESLKKHAQNWGHLGYIYAGNVKPFGVSHYLKELRDLAATGISARQILQKEKRQLHQAKRQQRVLYRKHKVNSLYRRLFEAGQGFAVTKLYRRHAQLLTLYLMHTTLLREIAKRLKLTRLEVQFMLKGEVKEALVEGKMLSKQILKQRLKKCALYTEKDFEKVYLGRQLAKIKKGLKNMIDKNQKELTGQSAMPGYAKGTVRIIIRAKDMPKMNKGDILVSIATDPDIVPAMKKAAAIVTEQGGITSHAAIVSRELGIPCVIGTKIATKIFKDGDLVEVDANRGIVRKL